MEIIIKLRLLTLIFIILIGASCNKKSSKGEENDQPKANAAIIKAKYIETRNRTALVEKHDVSGEGNDEGDNNSSEVNYESEVSDTSIKKLGHNTHNTIEPQAKSEPQAESKPQAKRPPTFISSQKRVVAIGDLHGDYEVTQQAIILSGVMNSNHDWIGKDTYLVQVGDQLDRGDGEKEIIDLLEKLKVKALKAGGDVIVLNGNHETMNIYADFRYVSAGGFDPFNKFYNSKYFYKGDLLSKLESIPSYQRGRAVAFHPGGPLATILSTHNTVVVIGSTLFVHGGITSHYSQFGLDRINEEVSQWMRGKSSIPQFVSDPEGPFWSRYFSEGIDEQKCLVLDEILKNLNLKRMVVAHTAQLEGINSACDQKIWRVDTGLSQYYGGSLEVLEILNDQEVRVLGRRNTVIWQVNL